MTLLDGVAVVTNGDRPPVEPEPTSPDVIGRSAPATSRSQSSRAAVVVAVGVAVLPVVVDPAGWHVDLAARWLVLVVGAVVGIAALAATGRLRAPAGHRWWLALVAVAAVSAAASSAPFVAFFGAVDRLGGAASWLVCGAAATIGAGVVRRRSDLRVVLRGMSAGAILVTGFVAAQRMGWRFAGSAVSGRPGGPLGNADFLGAFAVLATLVALGASLDRAERPAWRLWHVVATMGAGWCLVVSGTRGAWVGLVAGLVVMAPAGATIAARDRGRAAGVRRALAVVSLVMTALVGVGLLAGAADRVAEAGASRGTAAGRVATWRRTVDVIAERPVLGWGPEGFAVGFGRAVDASWEREFGRRLTPDRAHNGLADVAASLGLVGLAAYLGLVLASGRAVRRAVRRSAAPSFALVGVAAALVAYLVQQQFLFQLPDVDAIAWLLVGGLAALGRGAGPALPRRGAAVASVAAVVALTIVAAVASTGWTADREARRSVDARAAGRTSAALVAASRAVDRQPQTMYGLVLADAALADGSPRTLDEVRSRIGELRDRTPDDGRLTLARSRLARADGRTVLLADSVREVTALLRVDRARSEGWAELGVLRLALGDAALAQAAFDRAVELRPDRTDAWLGVARAAEQAGDLDAARDAATHLDPASLSPGDVAAWQRWRSGRQALTSGR